MKAFNGVQLRCMSPLPKEPDLIVGATEEEFVLYLRQGLSSEQRAVLLRHGAAHIALGHIRLGDREIHADRLEQLQLHPTRRWDAQVEALLSRLEAARPPSFAVQGLTEALAVSLWRPRSCHDLCTTPVAELRRRTCRGT